MAVRESPALHRVARPHGSQVGSVHIAQPACVLDQPTCKCGALLSSQRGNCGRALSERQAAHVCPALREFDGDLGLCEGGCLGAASHGAQVRIFAALGGEELLIGAPVKGCQLLEVEG